MAADRSQMFRSAAYAVLTPCARKVLAVIEDKITEGGGVATISLMDLARRFGRHMHRHFSSGKDGL
jgi:hypothetical protein